MATYLQHVDAGVLEAGTRRAPPPGLEDEVDLEAQSGSEEGHEELLFTRQISASPACHRDCLLVDCGVPSPTCADAPDAPRLEFPEFQRRAKQLAEEFFCARDCRDMIASISALGCPSFHDELVALLLRFAMDRKEPEREAVVLLLGGLSINGHLSGAQLARGFEKLVLSWDDLRLDVPDAPGQLAALLSDKVGLLDRGLFARLPEGLLRKICFGLAPGGPQEALDQHLDELVAFKRDLSLCLEANLFGALALEPIADWIRSADKPVFHHEVVVAACIPLLGKDAEEVADRERSVLKLLCHLSGPDSGFILGEIDVQMGFSRILGGLSRFATDEDAIKRHQQHVVSLLRGAVEHELLPAEFLKSARRLRFGGVLGVEALRQAQRQTPMHSRRVWGSGDQRQFQNEVREAILEFFDSGCAQEMGRIVEELHFSDMEQARFLRKLMVTGMERGEPEKALDAIQALLGRCWTLDGVRQAFEQLRDIAQDLVLDFPRCREFTTALVWSAAKRGLLEPSDVVADAGTIV